MNECKECWYLLYVIFIGLSSLWVIKAKPVIVTDGPLGAYNENE